MKLPCFWAWLSIRSPERKKPARINVRANPPKEEVEETVPIIAILRRGARPLPAFLRPFVAWQPKTARTLFSGNVMAVFFCLCCGANLRRAPSSRLGAWSPVAMTPPPLANGVALSSGLRACSGRCGPRPSQPDFSCCTSWRTISASTPTSNLRAKSLSDRASRSRSAIVSTRGCEAPSSKTSS